MTSSNQSDTVMVPVPVSFLGDVYRLLGDLAHGATPKTSTEAETGEENDLLWTVDELRGIARDQRASFIRVAKMLDVLAKAPGVPVSLSDMATATGLSNMQLRGGLSGFSRSVDSQYGEISWPMAFSWGASESQTGEAYYTLDPITAARWLEARG